ncbi:MAG TPA: hypothetical protein VG841_16180 [Caulobacterales bacterium]|nr:hypothetical protein [Caulobacterales bacterium]
MAKKQTVSKERRRTRSEIDRNYFFGDVLIKTGVAVAFAIAAIALYTPFSVKEAMQRHMYDYLSVMAAFGIVGVAAFFGGQHLRRVATHWDFD